jgi:hypothetical protein
MVSVAILTRLLITLAMAGLVTAVLLLRGMTLHVGVI